MGLAGDPLEIILMSNIQLSSYSLADEFTTETKLPTSNTLAISLGANIASQVGPPCSTLKAVRPEIESEINQSLSSLEKKGHLNSSNNFKCEFFWSPLFETDAVGGPENQPNYINAALVVKSQANSLNQPSEKTALVLLKKFLDLEKKYGRDRKSNLIKWGPRSLDIDFLFWGGLKVKHKQLILPHPRMLERTFVLIPLAEALSKGNTLPRKISSPNQWSE